MADPAPSPLPALPDLPDAIACDDAFDRIELTILPCLAMMIESLLELAHAGHQVDPKVMAAELETLKAELEALTESVERASPARIEPEEYRAISVV